MADIGGSLGLWLGLNIFDLLMYAVHSGKMITLFIQNYENKRTKSTKKQPKKSTPARPRRHSMAQMDTETPESSRSTMEDTISEPSGKIIIPQQLDSFL